MTDSTLDYRDRRGLAIAFGLCGLASLTLLASHPSGSGAHSLALVIKDLVAHQTIDGIVHGGFAVTLVALIICFVFLSRFLGFARVPVIIGLVCFCIGCSILLASMLLDGFASPAIAVRYAGAENAEPARTLFVLMGTLIGFCMPLGLLFQSVAMLNWSSVIVKARGLRRAVGVFGLVAASALIVAIFAVPVAMAGHVVLGGIVLQSIWYLALAAVLFGRDEWSMGPGAQPT